MAIFTLPISRVGDSNFRVGSGFKLYFYDAGTTDARDTYTDNTYETPLSNPVIADANGYFAVIWTTGDYKVRLTTADDVLVWEVDNYSNDFGSTLFAEGVLSAPSSAANAIVANLPTTPGELIDQLQVVVELQHGANTITNPTFNLNDLGEKTIKRNDNTALIEGDTGGDGAKIYLSYSATNDVWILLNPVYAPLRTYAEYPMGLEWKTGLVYIPNVSDLEHDIDIAAGSIMDSTNTVRMNISAITKRIDATWAAGTNAGGLSDADSLGNATWYGVFVLTKANGDSDAIFATTKARSLSDAAATSAGFIYSRLIGYVLTNGSANITRFIYNNANQYLWHSLNTQLFGSPSQVGEAVTVPVPPNQTGLFGGRLSTTSATTRFVRFTASQQANDAAAAGNADIACESDGTVNQRNDTHFSLYVGANRDIRYRCSHTADTSVRINTLGYVNDITMTDLV